MRLDQSAGQNVLSRLDDLARFSSMPGGLTRLYLTPEHKRAADAVSAWMVEAGLSVHLDHAGTVCGRREGPSASAPTLLLGSHIDTVRNAGKYDGAFGVVAAIEALDILHKTGVSLPFAVEILAFGDEEGVRFPVTLTGSRAVAGIFDTASLDATDAHGVALGDALTRFGCDSTAIPSVARDPASTLGYVELHIEQGPVLEAENVPVGIVTAIAGASRFAVDVTGTAGHAGTVPMKLRRDALCAASEMILAIESLAVGTQDLVATVGTAQAFPGATNVIPAETRFTIDIRSSSDFVRANAIARLSECCADTAERRRTGLSIRRTYDAPAAVCDPALMQHLEAAVASNGVRPVHLASGAGHDGLAMTALCPIAMLFVRCKSGISHNPAESITAADADVAVRVLTTFLRNLDPRTR